MLQGINCNSKNVKNVMVSERLFYIGLMKRKSISFCQQILDTCFSTYKKPKIAYDQ